jgi:GNAT superfamily N-acetyltransferase
MIIREARTEDISQMHRVRVSVKENILPDPAMITEKEYEDYLVRRGKGWICEIDNTIVGFSIVSVLDKNVWALFVQPGYENQGIAQKLHREMMKWYFLQTDETIWLGTAPGTRAERFYRKAGWKQTGLRANGEIMFEMTKIEWELQLYA